MHGPNQGMAARSCCGLVARARSKRAPDLLRSQSRWVKRQCPDWPRLPTPSRLHLHPRATLTRAVPVHAVRVASQPQSAPPSIPLGKLALFGGGALGISDWHCLSSAIVAICDFSVVK